MPSIPLSDPMLESPDTMKKEKKLKKSSKALKSETKEKKRKAAELGEDDDVESGTSSELVEPVKDKSKKKKAKVTSDGDEEVAKEESPKEEHPNAVSKFRICEKLREKLKENGIESLFPIQAMTFDTILDGTDLVGRARTGQGKRTISYGKEPEW